MLAAECSALKPCLPDRWWECSDLNDLVQETLSAASVVEWLKCCTPEVLQSLTVGKPGGGSQKELPFSMTSCSTVRLGVAHPGWDGMHNTGYH